MSLVGRSCSGGKMLSSDCANSSNLARIPYLSTLLALIPYLSPLLKTRSSIALSVLRERFQIGFANLTCASFLVPRRSLLTKLLDLHAYIPLCRFRIKIKN